MKEIRIPTLKCQFYLCSGGERERTQGQSVIFSMFGGLGGDFFKDTYEAKLFGMHI